MTEITFSTVLGAVATTTIGMSLLFAGLALWRDETQVVVRVSHRRWLATCILSLGVYFLLLTFTSRVFQQQGRESLAILLRVFLLGIGVSWALWLRSFSRYHVILE